MLPQGETTPFTFLLSGRDPPRAGKWACSSVVLSRKEDGTLPEQKKLGPESGGSASLGRSSGQESCPLTVGAVPCSGVALPEASFMWRGEQQEPWQACNPLIIK